MILPFTFGSAAIAVILVQFVVGAVHRGSVAAEDTVILYRSGTNVGADTPSGRLVLRMPAASEMPSQLSVTIEDGVTPPAEPSLPGEESEDSVVERWI